METTKTIEQRVADLYRRIDLLAFGLVYELGFSSSEFREKQIQERISEITICRRELDQLAPDNIYRIQATKFPIYMAYIIDEETGKPAKPRVFPHEKNAARILDEWATKHSAPRATAIDAALNTYAEIRV